MALEYTKAVFATLLIGASTLGFGLWMLPLLPRSFSPLSRYVCSWIAGYGLFGVCFFTLGLWSFTRATAAILVAAGLCSLLVHWWRNRISPGLPGKIPLLPALIIAFMLGLTALSGLAEPVGDWNVDEVAYHLAGPKVWLRDGIIRPIPDNAPTSYPSSVEMVFSAAMAFGGQRAPDFSSVISLSLFLLIVGVVAMACGLDASAAWWAAAVVVTMPAVYTGAHATYVDAVYAMYLLAAARIGFKAEDWKEYVLTGLFCGLAIAVKYPGLFALPIVLFCVALFRKDFLNRVFLGRLLVAAAVAAVVASPFYLKNWIFLGSPLYPPPPGAMKFLNVKYYSVEGLRGFYVWVDKRGLGHGHDLFHLLLLPFNLTYHTADFHGGGGIGLVPLAFGPLGIIASRRNLFARRLAVLGALLLAEWFYTIEETRYAMTVFAMGGVLGVLGWRYCVAALGRRGRIASAAIVAISLAYGLFMIVPASWPAIHSVFSAAAAQQRHETRIPFVASFAFINSDPSVQKVLILDPEVMAYYSDKSYVKALGQWWEQPFRGVTNGREILNRIADLHVTDVLDVRSSHADFQVPDHYPGLTLVFERPNQRIYRVDPLPGS